MQKWFPEPETRPFWTDAVDEVMGVDGNWHTTNKATSWRWRSAYQNDFAARLDWTVKSYNQANHPPVIKLDHADRLSAQPGERVNLSAEATDPDGNTVSYEWFLYGEAGTFRHGHPPHWQAARDRELRPTSGLVYRAHQPSHAARHRHHAHYSRCDGSWRPSVDPVPAGDRRGQTLKPYKR